MTKDKTHNIDKATREALQGLVDGKGWLIRDAHREAAADVLHAVAMLRIDADWLRDGWRNLVETAQREVREVNAARRGLERRNTDLERELDGTSREREHIRRDRDGLNVVYKEACRQRNDLTDERDALSIKVEQLRGELDRTRRERDRFFEKLSAVALNAKQIQVIVEKGLSLLHREVPSVADTVLGPAEEDIIRTADAIVGRAYHSSEEGTA